MDQLDVWRGVRIMIVAVDNRRNLLHYATLASVPDLTLAPIRNELAGRGVNVSYAGVQRTVRRLGLRFKKTIFATERDRPDVALARQLWQASQSLTAGMWCLQRHKGHKHTLAERPRLALCG